ncbi:hypothetical protein [Paraburkholderia sp. SUR17]|uniref:hypothetical protein n=1 Tax=Paraburkholderia sp. SUR17 TaxID=3034358 RepID=UPI002407B3AF|nr:hypothetical protein [Paraburkholderia sp. SUR17]WEY37754.1 hypothetical protein P2869_11770 [Paraburkholderia sp. SUR17]
MNVRDEQATEAQLKREILQILDALRERQVCYSFRLVGARLKAAKMPTAQGWTPLIEKFKDMAVSGKRLIECRDELMAIYLDSLKVGTRAVSVFKVSKAEAKRAADEIGKLVDSQSEFAQRFPFPLSKSKLARAPFNGVFCNAKKDGDGSVRLFACCKRAFRTREYIDLELLDSQARSALEGYDEIFGVRSGYVQGFDSIVVRPDAETVEVQLDIACRLTREDFAKARNFYTERVNSYFGEKFKKDAWLLLPENFYPFIQKLYASTDGIVNSLGHATTTNSIKEERMRGRKSDLRKERFHEEGMQAIKGSTDEYSIRKGWFSADGNRVPSVMISGNFAIAGGKDARVSYAIIEGCADEDDFAMVMSKLK